MLAAFEIFRVGKFTEVGRRARLSQLSLVRRLKPSPSAPSTTAVLLGTLRLGRSLCASSDKPIHQNSDFFSLSIALAIFFVLIIGMCSKAPEAALPRAPSNRGVDLSCTIMASAENATADRITAPRL